MKYLGSGLSNARRRRIWWASSMLACLALTLTFTGCLSNSGTSESTAAAIKGLVGTDSGDLPTGNTTDFINVDKVVRSNQDPNSKIELISSDGSIGTNCEGTGLCVCRFKFTEATGVIKELDQDPERVEKNLMRCLFTQVSSDASFFDVKIVISSINLGSNTIRINIGSANPSLDPSLNTNFLAAERFMCRDIIKKQDFNTQYYRNNSLQDPRLWDMGIAFTFYTTSFGLDYGATSVQDAQGNALDASGFECPPTPNDASFDPVFDLTLFSISPINLDDLQATGVTPANGDVTIYPPDDNQNIDSGKCDTGVEADCEKFAANRHDYYLATFKDGTFKQPICIIHNVASKKTAQLDCTVDGTKGTLQLGSPALGADVIGFAAVPDINQNCPGPSVEIPAEKKWAKVWQMRASFDQRSIQDVANANNVRDLFCTHRDIECIGNDDGTISNLDQTVCHSQNGFSVSPQDSVVAIGPQQAPTLGFGNCSSSGSTGPGSEPHPPTAAYVTPASGDNTCNDQSSATGVSCCKDIGQLSLGTTSRNANFTPGGDFCTPSLIGSTYAGAFGGLAKDVWLMGNGDRRACIEADTDALGKGIETGDAWAGDPLGTYIVSARNIDNASQSDFLYVVTPPSVKIENMQDPNDAVGKQYTPKRVFPDGSIYIYRFEADTDPSQTLSKFPLCVLQDTK